MLQDFFEGSPGTPGAFEDEALLLAAICVSSIRPAIERMRDEGQKIHEEDKDGIIKRITELLGRCYPMFVLDLEDLAVGLVTTAVGTVGRARQPSRMLGPESDVL